MTLCLFAGAKSLMYRPPSAIIQAGAVNATPRFLQNYCRSAAAWPPRAQAQQRTTPVVRFLGLTSPQAFAEQLAAFKRGLAETGFVERQNVEIEYRWAHGQFDQLSPLAADLAGRGLNVLAALGTPASAIAAKAATSTIPIVLVTGSDPVAMGLVDRLNRPTGNATGVYMLTSSLEPKRVEVMREAVPNSQTIGSLSISIRPTPLSK
jgi:putative ABC transport system substrate-binding protein